MILSTPGFIASSISSGVVSPYIAQYQAVLNYATSQGWTLPSDPQKIVQNTLASSFVSSGIFSKLDALYILANNGSAEFSSINWINPGSNNMLAVGATPPLFSLNNGWSSRGVNAYMDTQFFFSSSSKLKQTNAGVFVWVYSATVNGPLVGHNGSGTNSLTLRILSQNTQNHRIMTLQNTVGNIDFTGTGLKTAYAAPSFDQKYYNNNSLISSQNRNMGGPGTADSVGLFRTVGTYAPDGLGISILGFGENIQGSHSTLYNSLNTYMTNK